MGTVQRDIVLVKTFIALQITGTLAFLIIFMTALFSSQIVRHPAWFSFCFSWILWGISFSLLFFSGQQTQVTSQPLCIVQSALVYTVPLLAGLASVALITHLFLSVRSALTSESATKQQPWARSVSLLLVLVPWLLGVAVFVSFLTFAINHPSDIELSHNGTYCVIVNSFLPKITAAMGTLLSITIVVFEAVIGAILYRHRDLINGFPQSRSLAIQLVLFTAVALCSAGISLVFVITRTRGAVFDIMLGAVPVATSVIFGTQRDILRSWMFWKRSLPPFQPHQHFGSGPGQLSSIDSIEYGTRH